MDQPVKTLSSARRLFPVIVSLPCLILMIAAAHASRIEARAVGETQSSPPKCDVDQGHL
jgi:hypothetical protein